jgi:hypothetical protein
MEEREVHILKFGLVMLEIDRLINILQGEVFECKRDKIGVEQELGCIFKFQNVCYESTMPPHAWLILT